MATDLDALFAEHHRRVFRYLCRAVGHADTARDLTQDVFLRVSRTAIPAASNGQVNAWLFRIARNLALDYHRARLRQPALSPLVDDATRSASQDVSLAVNKALASLQELDRDAFLMREVAGLGYEEIARALRTDSRRRPIAHPSCAAPIARGVGGAHRDRTDRGDAPIAATRMRTYP